MIIKKPSERYEVERELARGAFGVAYLARDTLVYSRRVVIKILFEAEGRAFDDISDEASFRTMFERETMALARIDHPRVVHIYEYGWTSEGEPFIVMQYVEGKTLRAAMGDRAMGPERAAHIVSQLGAALTAVHDAGVVHRDLKPENVMLQTSYGDEFAILIDFGIAKLEVSRAERSEHKTWAGTPLYMAPEQLRGYPIPASDVWALGVVAYELVTGRRPFSAADILMLKDAEAAPVTEPRALCPALPKVAQAVILKALSYDPAQRHTHAHEMGREFLRAVLEGDPAVSDPVSISESPAEPIRGLAHVLFVDIVRFSVLSPDEQVQVIGTLHTIAEGTSSFRDAQKMERLISLDTGDGIALAFFDDYEAPVRCAIEIATALKNHPEIGLRMGVNTGPVYRRKGFGTQINITGDGINIAQRVMNCGDSGHILVAKIVADFLKPFKKWTNSLHDLGTCQVKHGVSLHLFNVYTDELGNSSLPEQLRSMRDERGQAIPDWKGPDPPRVWAPAWQASPGERRIVEALPRVSGQGILVQTLGVSHNRDTAGREGLIYAPAPLGEMAPDSEYVPLKWQFLKTKIEDIRDRIEDLNRRALVGKKRERNGLEAVTRSLSDHVLPVRGFAGMLGSGIHPQFDLVPDAASLIPWELLEESYYVCPRCPKGTLPHRFLDKGSRYCALCGERMEFTGGKLALTHHLTHLVRGGGRFGGEGKQFLFIEDPLGDLCSADKDPQGICARHLSELRSMIEQQGYKINLLEGKNATVNHVLSALDDDSLLGVYYFGHGFFPRNGDEGCLLLADEQLFASQILEIGPAVRFVFLNSCEGAASGRDWELEKRENSVASAFARGSRSKVVIAPIWPVINVHAAETAMHFFRQALRAAPLGEALRTARTNSFQRYEIGEPDISWGAYRYFGDPNRLLPVPSVAQALVDPNVAVPASRVFDSDGELNAELFAFAIDEVLLRAAKRRNLQNRTLVSVTDFLAGMIRKGDLTRVVLTQTGVNADEVYEKIGSQAEVELSTNRKQAVDQAASELEAIVGIDQEQLDEAKLREILAKWIVCYKEQFAPELAMLLAKADAVSQSRDLQRDDSRITEKVILESLVADDFWSRLSALGLPSAEVVLRCLQEIIDRGDVDENGAINLAALDDSSKKIIETAHVLAQQRGIFPITNRLTLAAFIAEKEGYASRACRLAGERPSLLYAWLIAASSESVPASFGLSPEACERIVIPVIAAAKKKNTSQDDRITEGNLFRAFCEVANPAFKEFLKLPPFLVDLDKLRDFDPDEQKAPPEKPEQTKPAGEELVAPKIDTQGPPLDDDASNIVVAAHTMARKIGVSPIPYRLMLAAFLIDPNAYTARLFKRHGIPADTVCAALIASAGGRFEEMVKTLEQDFRMPSEPSDEGMAATLKRARALSGNSGVITESTLFRSFCEIAAPTFKAWLMTYPVRIDLDALASDESGSHSDGDKPPERGSDKPDDLETSQSGPDPGVQLGELAEHGISQSKFDEGAWRILVQSAQLAQGDGWTEIRTPHLFATMIGDGSSPAGLFLQREHLNPAEAKKLVLSVVPARPRSVDGPASIRLGDNALKVIVSAIQLAKGEGRERVTEEDLFTSFFAGGGGVVGEVLHMIGVRYRRGPKI